MEVDEFLEQWATSTGIRTFVIHLSVAHTCHYTYCVNPGHLKAHCQKCHNHLDKGHRKLLRSSKQVNPEAFKTEKCCTDLAYYQEFYGIEIKGLPVNYFATKSKGKEE